MDTTRFSRLEIESNFDDLSKSFPFLGHMVVDPALGETMAYVQISRHSSGTVRTELILREGHEKVKLL